VIDLRLIFSPLENAGKHLLLINSMATSSLFLLCGYWPFDASLVM
jgi:hypothetical protein